MKKTSTLVWIFIALCLSAVIAALIAQKWHDAIRDDLSLAPKGA
jgi:uncharacterized membrane protein YhaH (DUF805 family)